MLIAARTGARSATIDNAPSYGTFSHLWASTAHESASSTPFVRWRSAGLAAAHRPNAPSTCSHAPAARVFAAISASGSNAPLATSPA